MQPTARSGNPSVDNAKCPLRRDTLQQKHHTLRTGGTCTQPPACATLNSLFLNNYETQPTATRAAVQSVGWWPTRDKHPHRQTSQQNMAQGSGGMRGEEHSHGHNHTRTSVSNKTADNTRDKRKKKRSKKSGNTHTVVLCFQNLIDEASVACKVHAPLVVQRGEEDDDNRGTQPRRQAGPPALTETAHAHAHAQHVTPHCVHTSSL